MTHTHTHKIKIVQAFMGNRYFNSGMICQIRIILFKSPLKELFLLFSPKKNHYSSEARTSCQVLQFNKIRKTSLPKYSKCDYTRPRRSP